MRHRWHQLRAQLNQDAIPSWARALGPRPTSADSLDSWLTAATAAAAYRERYELADHTDLIGPRPAPSRPDARAAHDHAQRQIDLHLTRTLHRLDSHQLAKLEAHHQSVLDDMPTFDPEHLDQAHRSCDDLYRQARTATHPDQKAHLQRQLDGAQRDVARLEHAAREHTQWCKAAARSTDTLRQIRLLTHLRASRPPTRAARRR